MLHNVDEPGKTQFYLFFYSSQCVRVPGSSDHVLETCLTLAHRLYSGDMPDKRSLLSTQSGQEKEKQRCLTSHSFRCTHISNRRAIRFAEVFVASRRPRSPPGPPPLPLPPLPHRPKMPIAAAAGAVPAAPSPAMPDDALPTKSGRSRESDGSSVSYSESELESDEGSLAPSGRSPGLLSAHSDAPTN